jgi:hypothetical protein
MRLRRSTLYNRLEQGTLITADDLRRAATNLDINRTSIKLVRTWGGDLGECVA